MKQRWPSSLQQKFKPYKFSKNPSSVASDDAHCKKKIQKE